MAGEATAVASGAGPSGDVARRRNVPGSAAPGAATAQLQPDEKKIHGSRKVGQRLCTPMRATR